MDETDKMDLVLNSDFDASLLDCWDSNTTGKNETKPGGNLNQPTSHSPCSSNSTGGVVNWDGTASPGFARLPSFPTEADGKSRDNNSASAAGLGSNAAPASVSQQWHAMQQKAQQMQVAAPSPMPPNDVTVINNKARKSPPVPVSTATSVTSAINKDSLPAAAAMPQHRNSMMGLTGKTGSKSQTTGGVDSSTNLESNQSSSSLTTSDTSNTTQMHPLAIPSSANCPPHIITATNQTAHAQMQQTVAGMQNALFPVALTALGGPTAAAFAAAGLSLPLATAQQNNRNPQQQPQQQTQQQQLFYPSQSMSLQANPQHSNTNTGHQAQQQQLQTQGQGQAQQGQDNGTNSKSSSQSTTPPPFYLFDAPVELRVNFMQSQRLHGLPVTEDNNSYHYGVAVNGFHPQLNAQLNPATGAMTSASGGSSSSGGSQNHCSSVQLVDARHSNRKAGRIKNEREQRRAQKITELIDQLREKMETGGWKVEVKSKFHTLSSCADYVKHLIKVTKEKEEAVNKAKSDLQMKERKVEEEKALQESRSDPESVMSSLTSSTGDSGNSNHHSAKKVSSENSSSEEEQRKRKPPSDSTTSNKKSRKSPSGHSGSSESSGEDPQRLNQQCLDKTTSSVSDITDSNKDSSNSGSDTQNSNQRSDDDDASGTPSSISASSSAAVVQGLDGKKHRTKHADVVIKERSAERPHKFPTEVTSLEESFVLDYEEVFVKSNVPQIIATTAGRIIAWNDFFLKATGISKTGVKGLTIFSLVKQEKLSNLFEIVAKALRKDASAASSGASEPSESTSNSMESQNWDYATMTLPCIEFPSSKERPTGKSLANPLYITVTLMADEDPRKRLFHCVFTDCPGTNGTLGSITPELLAMLFTRHWKPETSESRKSNKTGH